MDSKVVDLSTIILKKNLEALNKMTPGTKEYNDLLGRTSGLYETVNESAKIEKEYEVKIKTIEIDNIKNASFVTVEEAKLKAQREVEEIKIAAQKEIDAARLSAQKEIEDKRNKTQEDVETKKGKFAMAAAAIPIAGSILALVGTVVTVVSNGKTSKERLDSLDRRFELATKKEFDEPINTLTNKTTVQNGLKDYY